jgi:hypothetical protein
MASEKPRLELFIENEDMGNQNAAVIFTRNTFFKNTPIIIFWMSLHSANSKKYSIFFIYPLIQYPTLL